ncbi:MAG: hypothetical protein PHN57_02090 [Candidatus Omnitrophica bacterium]|nr:hypothetical protein [Candidatus Omnitrophota bacterium]
MAKYRYEVDENNRLRIRDTAGHAALKGRFSVDKENRLNYYLNEPQAWRRQSGLPSRIIFKGKWNLNKNHDLELVLDETKDQYGKDRLIFKGEIISVSGDELAFEIISRNKGQTGSIGLLKLSGLWQADEYNRICFQVKKNIFPDSLTFLGNWQIGKNQQITYLYEKSSLKTKNKSACTLTFEGFWQINARNRLTYILENSPKSYFEFRAQYETPNLYPAKGKIKFRIGIGARNSCSKRLKTICFYGAWKLNRNLGAVYDMEYGKGKVRGIKFGLDLALSNRDALNFSLTNRENEPVGLNIAFNHRFLDTLDAESFLCFKRIQKAAAVEAGVKIPF